MKRDFAFLLDIDVAAAEVLRAALGADRALIANVGVFDVFTGKAYRKARSRSPSK